jgi:hypothetical protein
LGLQIPQEASRVRGAANISLVQLRAIGAGTVSRPDHYCTPSGQHGGEVMRSILLWVIGVPIPIILLLALCTHHF